MNRFAGPAAIAVFSLSMTAAVKAAEAESAPSSSRQLTETIAALDAATSDAFNRCSEPGQTKKHASDFAPDVEFYHDTGSVTWSRQAMLANTQKYVCGKFRRERVPGSLEVLPIKDFAAIQQGVHRFCAFGNGECDGMADFTIVWRHRGAEWQISRVLSYGHRPNS